MEGAQEAEKLELEVTETEAEREEEEDCWGPEMAETELEVV